jgi:hypothetical protein
MSNKEAEGGQVARFEIVWEGALRTRQLPEITLIDLFLSGNTIPLQPAGTIGASMPYFENQGQVEEWRLRTLEVFRKHYTQAVIDGLASLLAMGSMVALIEMGLSPLTKPAVLADMMQLADKVLRVRLGMKQGRAPMWSAAQLSEAIIGAMVSLPAGTKITYDSVVEVIREHHRDRAPHSGESLRKMVKDSQLEWKALKAIAERQRKKNGKTESSRNRRNGNLQPNEIYLKK